MYMKTYTASVIEKMLTKMTMSFFTPALHFKISILEKKNYIGC